jgi:hypothetical protein
MPGVAGNPEEGEVRAGFIGVLLSDDGSGEKRKPYKSSEAEAPLVKWP